MTNTFVINGVTYKAKPFGFGMVCDLEDRGIDLGSAGKKPMSLVRAYFSICANVDTDEASELIEKHLINGGDLDSLRDALDKAINESDFFRRLGTTEEEKTPENAPVQKKTSRANSK